MKTITREKVVAEIVGYEAYDGTRFDSEKECKEYENSWRQIIKRRFCDLVVAQTNICDLLGIGTEEDLVLCVLLKDKTDVDYANQYMNIDAITYCALFSDDDIGKEVFVYTTYDWEWMTRLGTFDEIVDKMKANIEYVKEKKKENYKK